MCVKPIIYTDKYKFFYDKTNSNNSYLIKNYDSISNYYEQSSYTVKIDYTTIDNQVNNLYNIMHKNIHTIQKNYNSNKLLTVYNANNNYKIKSSNTAISYLNHLELQTNFTPKSIILYKHNQNKFLKYNYNVHYIFNTSFELLSDQFNGELLKYNNISCNNICCKHVTLNYNNSLRSYLFKDNFYVNNNSFTILNMRSITKNNFIITKVNNFSLNYNIHSNLYTTCFIQIKRDKYISINSNKSYNLNSIINNRFINYRKIKNVKKCTYKKIYYCKIKKHNKNNNKLVNKLYMINNIKCFNKKKFKYYGIYFLRVFYRSFAKLSYTSFKKIIIIIDNNRKYLYKIYFLNIIN